MVGTGRFVFPDPRAEASFGDWDHIATETVAILRSAAGRDPSDRDRSGLDGELHLEFNRLELAADPGLTIYIRRRARLALRGGTEASGQLGRRSRTR